MRRGFLFSKGALELKCESVKVVRGGLVRDGRFYRHDALRTFEGHTLAYQKGKVYKNFMDMLQQCDPICEFEIKDEPRG